MVKCILVGFDDTTSKSIISTIEQKFSQSVVIESVVNDIASLIDKLNKSKTQLVVFDVDKLGKETVEFLSKNRLRFFEVIFIGNDHHMAVQAFKLDVLDYIEKPLSIEEFNRAIRKINYRLQIETNLNIIPNRIGLPTNKGVVIMDPKEISYCEGSSNYSVIHLKNKKSEMISRTLREVENVLTRFNFYRIHKSYLVNFYEIGMLIKSEGGHVVMNDYPAMMLPVSKFVREDLQEKLNIV
ncbi:MAG: LytTR family transcriptional regulator DNA-binding domain-containing protein [Bacteroidota bacterium]|nr:LytTR family transcriptional regulator DNA-binding domain-containing protein [Bacteroidota bacterium]